MSTLGTAATAADTVLNIPAGLSPGSYPAPYTIDSENVLVTGGASGLPLYSVDRGQNGTAPATHALGAAVTAGWGGAGSTPTLAAVLTVSADAGGLAITDLADPSDPQDAATKAYVDSAAPTLAEVLTAGNVVPDNVPIKSSAGHSMEILAGDGGTAAAGGDAVLEGGNGDDGNGSGAVITAGGSGGDGTGGEITLEAGAAESGSGADGGDVFIPLHAGDGAGRHGQFIISGLPSADPHVAGALYTTAGVLHASTG